MRSNGQAHMQPRAVRPAPEPLALYLRAGRNDHLALMNLIAAGDAGCFGVVFDAAHGDRHKRLRAGAREISLTRFSTPGHAARIASGYNRTLAKLPCMTDKNACIWPTDFQDVRPPPDCCLDHAVERGYTEVLAPTHLVRAFDDPWLAIDVESTRRLREHLDQNDGRHIPLIYPLAISYEILRTPHMRAHVIDALINIKADAIWLKIDGLQGAHATPTGVKNFIAAAADFHQLGRKLVSDCIGGKVGLALMAFGAVGGIAHGVGVFERFDSGNLRRISKSTPFTPSMPVYMPGIDAMLSPKEAESLFDAKSAGQGRVCMPRYALLQAWRQDMLLDPKRHYMVQRMKEVAELGQFPESIRAHQFLDKNLRPATDRALQAASQAVGDDKLSAKLQANRKRLDNLRVALGKQLEKAPPRSYAVAPETRWSARAVAIVDLLCGRRLFERENPS